MAHRHNWTSALMLCIGLLVRWSKQGGARSLIRLTVPFEAGPDSKGRPFPREDSGPQSRRRLGSRWCGALLCIRSWGPSIFPIASPSHSMSSFTCGDCLSSKSYLRLVGCQRCPWIWWENEMNLKEVYSKEDPQQFGTWEHRPALEFWMMKASLRIYH